MNTPRPTPQDINAELNLLYAGCDETWCPACFGILANGADLVPEDGNPCDCDPFVINATRQEARAIATLLQLGSRYATELIADSATSRAPLDVEEIAALRVMIDIVNNLLTDENEAAPIGDPALPLSTNKDWYVEGHRLHAPTEMAALREARNLYGDHLNNVRPWTAADNAAHS